MNDPLIYRVRGRRPDLCPISVANIEPLFGVDFGEVAMGHLLREAPDGVIVARNDGRWFEFYRQGMREITRDNPGLIVEAKTTTPATLNAKLFWREVIQMVRERGRDASTINR